MAKKMTKAMAAAFEAYGIKADHKTNHIFCEPLNAWVPLMLVDGNDKIGHGVWHFSTFPGTHAPKAEIIRKAFQIMGIDADVDDAAIADCKGTCLCDCKDKDGNDTCYAKLGRYRMDSTNAPLVMRTYIARRFMDWLERAIIAQIHVFGITMCRVHASGDFFSNEYADMWVRIATACGACIFWTYTKTLFTSVATFDSLQNANVVKSFVPGRGLNYGHAGYIMQLYKELKAAGKSVWICKCGIDKEQHCNNCRHCFTAEYVLFLEHSTDYKPEKDPDFPAFVELVKSQIEEAA